MASSYVKWSTLYTCLLHSHKNNHFKGTESDVATIQQLRLMPKTITDDFTKDGLEIVSTMTTTSPTLNSSGKLRPINIELDNWKTVHIIYLSFLHHSKLIL